MPRNNVNYHEIACDYAMRGRQREIMNRFLKETENTIRQLDPVKDAEQIEWLQGLTNAGKIFYNRTLELNFKIEELVEDARKENKTSDMFGESLDEQIRKCREKGYLDIEKSGKFTKMFLEHWEDDTFEMGKDYVESGYRDLDMEEEEDSLEDLGEDVAEYTEPIKEENLDETDAVNMKGLSDSYDNTDTELDEENSTPIEEPNPYKDFIDECHEKMNQPGLKRNEIKREILFSIYAMREAERYSKAPKENKPSKLYKDDLVFGSLRYLDKNERTFTHLFNHHTLKELKEMKPEEQLKAFKQSRYECKYTIPEDRRAEFSETVDEVISALKKTGKGTYGGIIPRFRNHQRYQNAVDSIRRAAEPSASAKEVHRSIKDVQHYLEDKKEIRDRGFGNVRVNNMLKYLSQVMPAGEFEKYLDEFNEARGIKDDPLNPDYLAPEDFMKDTTSTKELETYKAAAEAGRVNEKDMAKIAAIYKNSIIGLDQKGKVSAEDTSINQRQLKNDSLLMLHDEDFKYLLRNVSRQNLLEDIRNGGQKYFADVADSAAKIRQEKEMQANANSLNKR